MEIKVFVALVVGLVLGGCGGLLVTSMCAAAKKGENEYE